jgi:hypothetical protein
MFDKEDRHLLTVVVYSENDPIITYAHPPRIKSVEFSGSGWSGLNREVQNPLVDSQARRLGEGADFLFGGSLDA